LLDQHTLMQRLVIGHGQASITQSCRRDLFGAADLDQQRLGIPVRLLITPLNQIRRPEVRQTTRGSQHQQRQRDDERNRNRGRGDPDVGSA